MPRPTRTAPPSRTTPTAPAPPTAPADPAGSPPPPVRATAAPPVPPYEAADAARAVRALLVPRVSSVTVLGTGPAVGAHLAALVREVPGLGNVTVHPGPAHWPDPETAALAAAHGTVLATADSRDRALLGADLVVLTTPAPPVDRTLLAPSAVILRAAP
ncbi:hypothetical protein ACIQRS_06400 [Streptomyces termitum]|uniref:Uncharacterized protein n=1 Tax=Streptomyces termitum TaxID=67368 RepID=A0A918SY44_9ACTN|nr:hypothetical protein [Streptomyces termitum]GHA75563.1 hypothetical protein GCM10010305_17820 [Streptomyces termitum]